MPIGDYLYGNQPRGPVDDASFRAQAAADPKELVWREGLADWVPVGALPERKKEASPPPVPRRRQADEIDDHIVGHEMQFVEVELDPGEAAIAEAGPMYKDQWVAMETVFFAERSLRLASRML